MIHHNEQIDEFIDGSLAVLHEATLSEIDLEAKRAAENTVAWLKESGSMFDHREVYDNQYNGYLRRLGEFACVMGVKL